MRQFAKLDLSIIDSSIWFQPDHVFRVWIVMICRRDYRTGILKNTILGLARDAGRTIEETRDALRVLMAPDEFSRTDDNDGRRIEEVKGGWRLLNHRVYNELISAEEERERKKKWAAENRVANSSGRVAECSGDVAVSSDLSTSRSDVDPRSDLLSTISPSESGSDPDPEGASAEPAPPSTSRKGRFAPEDFAPSDAHRVRCQELHFDMGDLLRRFKVQEFTRDYSNWDKRFSVWIEDQRIKRETDAARAMGAKRKDQPNQPNCGLTGLEIFDRQPKAQVSK